MALDIYNNLKRITNYVSISKIYLHRKADNSSCHTEIPSFCGIEIRVLEPEIFDITRH